MACKLFDPFFLEGKEEEIGRLNMMARDLNHFEYKEFDHDFFVGLEKEIPLAVEHANREFDWNTIQESKEYKIRIDRKIKRRKLENSDNLDWKADPGEKAARIWKWWKLRMLDSDDFRYFREALRLVVLTEVSS